MKNTAKRVMLFSILIVSLFFISLNTLFAQEGNQFPSKGKVELGGNITFQSLTSVTNGNTGTSFTYFTMTPFIGYFVTDNFEIGLNPFGLSTTSGLSSSISDVRIFLAPSYNFKTKSIFSPFIEALFGYNQSSNGSRSGFSWGGRTGLKIAVTESGLLNIGVQYLVITLNRENDKDRNGINEFTFAIGFTLCF